VRDIFSTVSLAVIMRNKSTIIIFQSDRTPLHNADFVFGVCL